MKVLSENDAKAVKEANKIVRKGKGAEVIATMSEHAKIHRGKAVTYTAGEDFKNAYPDTFPLGLLNNPKIRVYTLIGKEATKDGKRLLSFTVQY